jgi:hypothetical protein
MFHAAHPFLPFHVFLGFSTTALLCTAFRMHQTVVIVRGYPARFVKYAFAVVQGTVISIIIHTVPVFVYAAADTKGCTPVFLVFPGAAIEFLRFFPGQVINGNRTGFAVMEYLTLPMSEDRGFLRRSIPTKSLFSTDVPNIH